MFHTPVSQKFQYMCKQHIEIRMIFGLDFARFSGCSGRKIKCHHCLGLPTFERRVHETLYLFIASLKFDEMCLKHLWDTLTQASNVKTGAAVTLCIGDNLQFGSSLRF